ncbi:peptidase S41 [Streptomyces sp. 150FB]|uniref:S41 family peptidase n=1 Tax=Streptomyces sp. 150FB TaxID=1576605 RepID=UPI0005891AF2|nr:S41 family peptidase [Streptomyces sp. 150FB]KIF74661.1 peptidase S41 [Streptomyces sp. 150FB]
MSGSELHHSPRAFRRGATLTFVFASVLATAAATNSLPGEAHRTRHAATRSVASTVDAALVAKAAAEAMADGKSGTEAAEEVVSRSGDRWGAVYDKGEYEEFEQALDGTYTGVGLWARRTAEGLVEVTRVQPGGPAARAGVRAGDTVTDIDGSSVAKRPVTEVMGMLRGDSRGPGAPAGGAAGSSVTVSLDRAGHHWTEHLRRAELSTESVTVGTLTGGARLIKVDSFTKGTGERVKEAVRSAPKGAGVLLDLRGNGGGLVAEAVTAASAFLDGGLVATYDIKGEQRALYASGGGDTGRPLVVLVDSGTMSAAELLTGALQDRGRAVTVGARTFGKGSVQMPSKLPDGSVAELTVGHYRTPSGHAVDGRGITPDVAVTDRAQQRAETVLSGLGGTA